MILKTTEQKIRDAGWSNLMNEPGYFTRKFGKIKTVIAKEDLKKASSDEVCNYEFFYYPKATLEELNAINDELKKLDEN